MRLAALIALCCCAFAQERRLAYPDIAFGDYKPIPKFDKGYVFSLERGCLITASDTQGRLMFRQQLQAPGGLPCELHDAAVSSSGAVTVAVSFIGTLGYTGAILRLDSTGKTVATIETGLYAAAHIGIDRDQSLWTIGSQRDEVNSGTLAKTGYFLVRKYSKDNKLIGEFIPRSLWGPRGDPGGGGRGYWRLAVARDKIAAIMHEGWSDQIAELIEWDLDGKLITRTPIGETDCGRVYTESGRFYANMLDKQANVYQLMVLDTQAQKWKPTGERHYRGEIGLMLGAQGDDIVYRATSGPDLIWRRPQ